MSIFSSIGNAVKSVASTVYNTVNSVGNYVSSAIGLGSSTANTASALQGTFVPGASYNPGQSPRTIADLQTYRAGSGVGNGASGSYSAPVSTPVSYKSLQTPSSSSNYSSASYASPAGAAQNGGGAFFTPAGGTPVSTVVNANQLGSSNAAIPSAPSGTNYHGAVVGNNVGVGGNLATGMLPVNGQQVDENGNPIASKDKPPADNAETALQKYLAAEQDARANPDIEGAYRRAQNEGGVIAATQQRNNTQNAINAITTKMNTDLLQLRGTAGREGVTEAVYGGQQAEVTREATISLLPLQAQLAADQGNLDLATQHTDTLFKIYSQEAQQSADNWNNQAKAIYEYATAGEKRKLDEISKDKEYLRDTASKEASNQNTIANELLKAGNMAGYKAVTGVRVPTNVNSPTYAQDFANYKNDLNSVISKYGGSIGATDRAKASVELENAKLAGDKLRTEIAANQPVTGEYAGVINGAAGLVASTKKTQVKTNIANAIAGGDFKTAYAETANAVSDGLTGSVKTKFDDARTDVNIMYGMRNAIQNYANAGGDMGLLKGTEEQIKRKLGVDSGKASTLATQLWREFQTYRSNMTGAAFTPAESRDYAAVNPTLGKSLDLNLSVIDGALNQLTNRVISTVNARLPEAQKLYDKAFPTATNIDTNAANDLRNKYGY